MSLTKDIYLREKDINKEETKSKKENNIDQLLFKNEEK